MAPLPGSPPPNMPGTGASGAPAPASVPNPAAQHPQGARVPTDLPYGQHQALMNAQHAMPVAGHAGPGSPAAPGQGPLPPDHPAVLQAAQNFTPPIQPLTRPSERPFEPVTSGAAGGPGPGPEALSITQPIAQQQSVSLLLQKAAAATNSPVLSQMAQRAAAAGQ